MFQSPQTNQKENSYCPNCLKTPSDFSRGERKFREHVRYCKTWKCRDCFATFKAEFEKSCHVCPKSPRFVSQSPVSNLSSSPSVFLSPTDSLRVLIPLNRYFPPSSCSNAAQGLIPSSSVKDPLKSESQTRRGVKRKLDTTVPSQLICQKCLCQFAHRWSWKRHLKSKTCKPKSAQWARSNFQCVITKRQARERKKNPSRLSHFVDGKPNKLLRIRINETMGHVRAIYGGERRKRMAEEMEDQGSSEETVRPETLGTFMTLMHSGPYNGEKGASVFLRPPSDKIRFRL